MEEYQSEDEKDDFNTNETIQRKVSSTSSEDGPILSQKRKSEVLNSTPLWLQSVNNSLNKFAESQKKTIEAQKKFQTGIYLLTRLVQCKSETVSSEASNILITFSALEDQIRLKMKIYLPYTYFIKCVNPVQANKILVHNILLEQQSLEIGLKIPQNLEQYQESQFGNTNLNSSKFRFIKDAETCICGQIVFNKNYLYENYDYHQGLHNIIANNRTSLFRYDLGNNEIYINFIKKLLNSKKLYDEQQKNKNYAIQEQLIFATGSYLDIETNQLTFLNINPCIDERGQISGQGITQIQDQQFQIVGNLDILKANDIELKKNYDYDLNFETIGSGHIRFQILGRQFYNFNVEITFGMNLYFQNPQLVIYGFDEEKNKLLTFKINVE